MILDLNRFVARGRPVWNELERFLERLENEPDHRLTLSEIQRFHYLYQRASADLAKLVTFAAEGEIHQYLEALVVRAYGEIHETRGKPHRLRPWHFLTRSFPRAFRRRVRAFYLAVIVTLIGALFGGLVLALDPGSKNVIMPFGHLLGSPSERVHEEETSDEDRLAGQRAAFSSHLMTHNTKVSILAMALGLSYGVGTILLLFYNGVILGAVAVDYVLAGESAFLAGWLLPHGSVEIPSILIAGQAGLVLGKALLGSGRPVSLTDRLREVTPDLVTLIGGCGLLLIWAGLVESFLSQYHEPVLPYAVKISFGLAELVFLAWFLARSGLEKPGEKSTADEG